MACPCDTDGLPTGPAAPPRRQARPNGLAVNYLTCWRFQHVTVPQTPVDTTGGSKPRSVERATTIIWRKYLPSCQGDQSVMLVTPARQFRPREVLCVYVYSPFAFSIPASPTVTVRVIVKFNYSTASVRTWLPNHPNPSVLKFRTDASRDLIALVTVKHSRNFRRGANLARYCVAPAECRPFKIALAPIEIHDLHSPFFPLHADVMRTLAERCCERVNVLFHARHRNPFATMGRNRAPFFAR